MTAAEIVLGAGEQRRLLELERVVDDGLENFVKVGQALAEINGSRLYRATHGTFAEYTADRFGIGKSQAYRLINASKVVEAVSPVGDIHSEREARELAGLPDNIAQVTLEVAKGFSMLTRGSNKPTAPEIAEARQQVLARPIQPAASATPDEARAHTDELRAAAEELAATKYGADLEGVEPDPTEPSPSATQEPTSQPAYRKPPRKPLTEVAKTRGFALRQAMDSVLKLTEDDRYRTNEKQVADALRGHLLYVAETVAAVLDQLP